MRVLLAALLVLLASQARAETPVLRAAVLKFGTVNWLTDVIRHHGLDVAEGVRLETIELAGREASGVAFQAGEVDLIVADWLWALNRREAGLDIRFFPYSRALGALMVAADSPLASLCELAGRRLGVVGGPLDKGWLVYQALARRDCGVALRTEAETLFGAPPLMSRQLETGAVDAVSTYWHFAARLEAAGMRRLTDVTEATAALGVSPTPALVGWVWNAARTEPAHVAALGRAIFAAGRLMAESDAEWERLRPLMQVESDAEFIALRDAYRDGAVVEPWDAADTAAAAALHAVLTEAGGPEFAADSGPFDPAAFPSAE